MPFTTLSCGHVFHRLCIEKKILPDILSMCPFPKCAKAIETGGMSTRQDSESFQSSGTSAISNLFDDSFTMNSPTIGQNMDVDKDGEEVVSQPDASSKKRA